MLHVAVSSGIASRLARLARAAAVCAAGGKPPNVAAARADAALPCGAVGDGMRVERHLPASAACRLDHPWEMAMRTLAVALGLATLLGASQALALDEVTFGTNWLAEPEHGGYYQAVADGTYEKYGLKVTIRQGGPQAANRALLIAGKIDFFMGGNMLEPFSALEQGIPTVVVGAIFQKEPQVLLAHPGQGIEKFEDLQKLTLFLSNDGFASYFQWMKAAYPGFKDEQVRPYTFNPAPFIADKRSAQQGYVTSEPYAIEREGGFKPKTFLLADYGFDTYSTLIETRREVVEKKRDLVQRFVDASIIGWYNYLYGDNAAANALIKKDNPEMTDGQIAFSIKQLKDYGIIVSGEAETKGIGCMTAARQKSFYDKMIQAKVVKADLDLSKAYTLDFICKGVGMNLKR
jgi:NitT/TauT family transport system substrate-binding protein